MLLESERSRAEAKSEESEGEREGGEGRKEGRGVPKRRVPKGTKTAKPFPNSDRVATQSLPWDKGKKIVTTSKRLPGIEPPKRE
jgi:hypothetical protein